MTTVLVPILKNRNGDIASKSNRPIALSTVASKILEIILVNHTEEYIVTTENQFAYKKVHSPDMCIFTLKECIRYYTVHSTPMYVCFLDAIKAFDCINHSKLFKVLIERKCPAYVIKLLVYSLTLSQWSSSGNPVCPEPRSQCTLECHWRKNYW